MTIHSAKPIHGSKVPRGILYGLGSAGSLFLSFAAEAQVMDQLTTKPLEVMAFNSSIAPGPARDPVTVNSQQKRKAAQGVSYFLCRAAKIFGSKPTDAMAQISLAPAMKKLFHTPKSPESVAAMLMNHNMRPKKPG